MKTLIKSWKALWDKRPRKAEDGDSYGEGKSKEIKEDTEIRKVLTKLSSRLDRTEQTLQNAALTPKQGNTPMSGGAGTRRNLSTDLGSSEEERVHRLMDTERIGREKRLLQRPETRGQANSESQGRGEHVSDYISDSLSDSDNTVMDSS